MKSEISDIREYVMERALMLYLGEYEEKQKMLKKMGNSSAKS